VAVAVNQHDVAIGHGRLQDDFLLAELPLIEST
jgi:hypothetical protein